MYRGYFHDHYPARAFIGVASLVRNGRLEIQGVAVKARGCTQTVIPQES
jgi:hypothetical protein